MKIKFFIICAAVVMGTSVCLPAFAQIYIDKAKIEMTVAPGQYIADKIVVFNDSEQARKVKIYMEDFAYKAPFDGSKDFAIANTLPRSNANWITYSPRDLTIPPKDKMEVSYIVNVPQDVQGGYYGVLIFENVPEGIMDGAKTGVRLITRIGALMLFETENSNKIQVFDNFRVENGVLKFLLSNQGDTFLRAGTVYYAMDADGNVADRGNLKDVFIPMGEKTDVELPIKADLPDGEYTYILTFDLQHNLSVVREVDIKKSGASDIRVLAVRE